MENCRVEELSKYFKKTAEKINGYLDGYLEQKKDTPPIIIKAMRYSVFAGGKRLRPILTLATAEMLGGKDSYTNAIPAACAIEMIHTYSLIHDDLPCMDNDDYRRGQLTNHKKFGENIAVLAGDALLTHAFYIISKYSEPQFTAKLVELLSYYSGIDGMLGGQVLDVINENKEIDNIEIVQNIHLKKTAALIKCSILLGAVCGYADKKTLKILKNFGENIGLAFQIVDDILDLTETTEQLGKPAGSDLKKKKSTYPAIIGIENSNKLAYELLEKSKKLLTKLEFNTELLAQIAELLVNRNK